MAHDKARKARADAARYERTKAQLSARRKAQRLANKPVVREGAPTKEELRKCIEQGYCWWCQRGGWRRLGQHTAMAHQSYAADLREMAVLLKKVPTCTPNESAVLRERRLALLAQGKVTIPDWRLGLGVPHEYSEAGRASQREHARHMRKSLTPEVVRRSLEASAEATRKPHPCPVCGTIVPRSTPICCSTECRKKRQQIGLEIGHRLWYDGNPTMRRGLIIGQRLWHEGSPIPRDNLAKGRKLWQVSEHRERMLAMLNAVRQKPKTHRCRVCGGLIRKSRPRVYCSLKCAHNPFDLPLAEIKDRYLKGESSTVIAKSHGCCDHTIRRHLRKAGVAIRSDGSGRYQMPQKGGRI